jgi:Mitochondrial protein Pet127
MRAQLDAQDPRLPGSGVFDIKTRAAVAIRYDPLNYKVSHRDTQEGCGTDCFYSEKYRIPNKDNPRRL